MKRHNLTQSQVESPFKFGDRIITTHGVKGTVWGIDRKGNVLMKTGSNQFYSHCYTQSMIRFDK